MVTTKASDRAFTSLYLFKNAAERWEIDKIDEIPNFIRGIYALLQENCSAMNVVYIGMARGDNSGIKGRLKKHRAAMKKDPKRSWTHFSAFEVWDNISKQQVEELEGVFRQIYAKDLLANTYNKQKTFKPLKSIVRNNGSEWRHVTSQVEGFAPPKAHRKRQGAAKASPKNAP